MNSLSITAWNCMNVVHEALLLCSQLFSKSIASTTVTVTGAPDELEQIAHKVTLRRGSARQMRSTAPEALCRG